MTSLSDRLSVVRPQWEAQLDAFHTLTTRALDSAEQLFALNMKTSRASMEQATGTLHQMLHATDARDLFAIGTQAQDQWQHMFSYSRELLGIAMGARPRNWNSLPLNTVPAPLQLIAAPAVNVVEQAGIAFTEANTVGSEIAAAAADTHTALAEATLEAAVPPKAPADVPTELDAEKTGEAPSEVPDSVPPGEPPKPAAAAAPAVAVEDDTSVKTDSAGADDAPPARAKPLVEAMNEIVARPSGAEHPIASTVPLEAAAHVELPLVAPPDSTPPVKTSNGPAPAERRRTSRKKS